MRLRTFIRQAARSRVRPGTAVLIGLGVSQVANLATTIYLHRQLAHRALELDPRLARACELIVRCSTGMVPLEWAAIHQQHHAHTDEPGDPHSPLIEGLYEVQAHNVRLYKEAKDTPDVQRRLQVLTKNNPGQLDWLSGGRGLAIGIGTAIVVFGPIPGLIISLVHWPVYIGQSASVNGVGHAGMDAVTMQQQNLRSRVLWRVAQRFGYRNFDTPDTSWNLPPLAFATAGEGYHNNHHAQPESPTFALQPGELDLGWVVIKALQRRQLVTIRESELTTSS